MGRDRDLSRFESKLQKADGGCWNWRAGLKGGGYGVFWLDGALRGAHRASLFLYRGLSLETPMDAMHSCDNPKCVNPDHLSYGTRAENMRDASTKGRTVNVSDWGGTKNPKAKLTSTARAQLELDLRDHLPTREIATKHGITMVRVQQIRRELSKTKKDGGGWDVEEF